MPIFGSYVLTEGAGLFAEKLALDSTLYDYPDATITTLTKLAALQSVMLRAVRLVVDTGIHTGAHS